MLSIPPITCVFCFIVTILSLMAAIGVIWIFKVRNERVFIKKESDGIDWGIDDIK